MEKAVYSGYSIPLPKLKFLTKFLRFHLPNVRVVCAAGNTEAEPLVPSLQRDVLALPLVLPAISLPEEKNIHGQSQRMG